MNFLSSTLICTSILNLFLPTYTKNNLGYNLNACNTILRTKESSQIDVYFHSLSARITKRTVAAMCVCVWNWLHYHVGNLDS